MPARPQQRTSRVRSIVSRAVPPRVADFTWLHSTTIGNVVVLGIQVNPLDLIISGIPQISVQPGDQVPVSAVLTGTSLALTYPVTVTPGSAITWPGQDPAYRTRWGGYAAGFTIYVLAPAAEIPWTFTRPTGNNCDITPTGGPADWAVALPSMTSQPSAEVATSVAWDGVVIRGTFTNDISADTSLVLVCSTSDLVGLGAVTLESTTVAG